MTRDELKQPRPGRGPFDPFDVALGARVRAARTARRMGQDTLGRAIGVTFQQVQKYERGANRISAATLARIATALEVSVSEFWTEEAAAPSRPLVYDDPLAEELLALFNQLPSARLRRSAVHLLKASVELVRAPSSED